MEKNDFVCNGLYGCEKKHSQKQTHAERPSAEAVLVLCGLCDEPNFDFWQLKAIYSEKTGTFGLSLLLAAMSFKNEQGLKNADNKNQNVQHCK